GVGYSSTSASRRRWTCSLCAAARGWAVACIAIRDSRVVPDDRSRTTYAATMAVGPAARTQNRHVVRKPTSSEADAVPEPIEGRATERVDSRVLLQQLEQELNAPRAKSPSDLEALLEVSHEPVAKP